MGIVAEDLLFLFLRPFNRGLLLSTFLAVLSLSFLSLKDLVRNSRFSFPVFQAPGWGLGSRLTVSLFSLDSGVLGCARPVSLRLSGS